MSQNAPQMLQKVRERSQEIRGNLKKRVEEWKERGWRAPETQKKPLFPRIKEIRQKGFASAMRARREGARGQKKEEIEPAFPKDQRVKEGQEIRKTVGKREIAVEL